MGTASGNSTEKWLDLYRQLYRSERRLHTALSAAAQGCELTIWQALVLVECSKNGDAGIGQRQLSDELGVSPPQISTTVESLRRSGLIVGQRDPRDRRRQVWSVTDTGRVLRQRFEAEIVRHLATRRFFKDRRQLGKLGHAVAQADFPPTDSRPSVAPPAVSTPAQEEAA